MLCTSAAAMLARVGASEVRHAMIGGKNVRGATSGPPGALRVDDAASPEQIVQSLKLEGNLLIRLFVAG